MSTLHGDLHASESTNGMDAEFVFQLTRWNIAQVSVDGLWGVKGVENFPFLSLKKTSPLVWVSMPQ